ncbi:MAG: hypothetical protein ACYSUM_22545 [Planctomycetota bacterium]
MIRILVDSTDPGTTLFLRGRLDADRFRIVTVAPDTDFEAVARKTRPQIAVVDQIHARQEVARARIAALKQICPDIRVIAVSEHPSGRDGLVVEQGLFYYLTLGVGPELVRIIEAGARAIEMRPPRPEGVGP